MKHLFKFIISFILCSGINALADNTISLKPQLTPIPHPRTKGVNVISVSATTDGEELAIYFSSSVRMASITLTDETGEIIYQETVNINTTLDFYIPISGLDSGNYTLTVEYSGTSLSGSFTI